MKQGPIGLFDSGAGGLFVLENLRLAFPHEDFIFLADTAHFPYGEKSDQEIQRLALQCGQLLFQKGCKMIVVACNTATAYALELLKDALPIPVVGPIISAAEEAMKRTDNGKIGVLATKATVRSKIYEKLLDGYQPIICESPLLASLVQEGDLELLESALNIYMKPLIEAGIDTLILGCTHYPYVEQFLTQCSMNIVDSAKSFIATLALGKGTGHGDVEYIVTGEPLQSISLLQLKSVKKSFTFQNR
jgi:glutamate racemase